MIDGISGSPDNFPKGTKQKQIITLEQLNSIMEDGKVTEKEGFTREYDLSKPEDVLAFQNELETNYELDFTKVKQKVERIGLTLEEMKESKPSLELEKPSELKKRLELKKPLEPEKPLELKKPLEQDLEPDPLLLKEHRKEVAAAKRGEQLRKVKPPKINVGELLQKLSKDDIEKLNQLLKEPNIKSNSDKEFLDSLLKKYRKEVAAENRGEQLRKVKPLNIKVGRLPELSEGDIEKLYQLLKESNIESNSDKELLDSLLNEHRNEVAADKEYIAPETKVKPEIVKEDNKIE